MVSVCCSFPWTKIALGKICEIDDTDAEECGTDMKPGFSWSRNAHPRFRPPAILRWDSAGGGEERLAVAAEEHQGRHPGGKHQHRPTRDRPGALDDFRGQNVRQAGEDGA